MNSIGRFALASRFELVERFFAFDAFFPPQEPDADGVRRYTKGQLGEIWNLQSYGLGVQQWGYQDDHDDYATRMFVWNSTSFQLTNDVRFCIDANGRRHIDNLGVEPRREGEGTGSYTPENFDFESDDPWVTASNAITLPRYDPSGIGRRIDFQFVGEVETVDDYDLSDWGAQRQIEQGWTTHVTPFAALEPVKTLLRDLFDNGVTKTLDDEERPIAWGTPGDDEIISGDISTWGAFLPEFIHNGTALIGGDGNDRLVGWLRDDRLLGGEGNDKLLGMKGDDRLEGEEGNDEIRGGEGADRIDGGDDDDDLRGDDGNDELNGDDGNDTISGGLGADDINGGNDDDTIDGGAGDDVVNAGEGNDEIRGGDGVDALFGGSGDDLIVGGAGGDRLVGWGDQDKDTLTGGIGGDLFQAGHNDVITDIGEGDRVEVGNGGSALRAATPETSSVPAAGRLLIGGEREAPPQNPCDPDSGGDEEDDGTYESADGIVYRYNKGSGTLAVEAGGISVTLHEYRNGDGGIRLRETRPDQDQAECQRDPLILDLDGDREVVTELFDSTAYFDLDNDGMRERVAWMDAGDGLLAMDRDGNGTIDNGSELFGTGAVDNDGAVRGTDGFTELARLDSNGDFQITSADANFAALRVWRDANMDGISDAGELVSLAELGIVSIGVRAHSASSLDCGCDGTIVDRAATVLTANGDRLSIFGAYLSIDQYDTIAADPDEVSADAAGLPFLIGSGSLVGLDVAMSRDPALLEMVGASSQLDAANAGDFLARVEAILLRWTEADEVAPDSRGGSINARWLTAIEKVSGSAFDQARVGADPRGDAALILIGEWHEIVSSAAARLLGQTELGETLLPGLSFEAGAFYVAADGTTLAGILAQAAANAPAAMADALPYWHLILGSIEAFAEALGVKTGQIDAAADDLLAAAGIGLSPAQLRAAQFAGSASESLIGTTPLNNVGAGADVLVAGAGVATVAAGGANDIIVVARGLGPVEIDAGSGEDLLWLVDRNRADVTVRAERVDGAIIISLDDASGGQIASFSAELLPSGVVASLENIRFADAQISAVQQHSIASRNRTLLHVAPAAGIGGL